MVMDRVAWKVSVAGGKGTGKSALISRVVYDSDSPGSASKLLSRKRLVVDRDGTKISADLLLQEISDRPEAERFLPGSNIILVLVDVTNPASLDFAHDIVKYSKTFEKKPQILLVGTKSDMKYEAQIWTEDIEKIGKKEKLDYVMVSSRTGEGIPELLNSITDSLVEKVYAKRQRTA